MTLQSERKLGWVRFTRAGAVSPKILGLDNVIILYIILKYF